MFALLLTLALAAPSDVATDAASDAPDTVIVGPRDYLPVMQPWIEHRTAQGHRIAYVPNTRSAEEIRGAIRQAARRGELRHVVLVGDAEPAAEADAAIRDRCVPAHLAKAKVNVRWGSEPEIATDNWYADLDDDQLPDVAIGRLTADSKEELALMIHKILAYENDADHGRWQRRINLVAGVGGFGKVVDTVLETATKTLITNNIPSAYHTTMTYGSWRSPFCPDPRAFHLATLERLNEGCLFWVYIGHGWKTGLDRVSVPGSRHHIFDLRDVEKLNSANGLPIAVFLACYTGAYDDPRDCLAEEMLRAERGPVAILCGSRVTMPYAMAVMSDALLHEYFAQKQQTLGEVFLHAKRRMVAPAAADAENGVTNRLLMDAIAAAISPSAELLEEERIEHLHLFNLLGDPMLRVHKPATVTVGADSTINAGEPLQITCEAPIAGRCTIELVCRRDRLTFTPPAREQYSQDDDVLAEYERVYRLANDGRFAAQTLDVTPGEFRTTLAIPEDARGSCHVRVCVEGEAGFAVGSADLFVRRPSSR